MRKKVDIIISCYNEEENILPFFNETIKYLDDKYDYNLVYVDDGSVDGTYDEILKMKNSLNCRPQGGQNVKVSVLSFIHNFGHEAAMCAGIEKSNADYMIIMDVDLQNPPSKIPEIMKEFENGADTVLMRRVKYNSATPFKKFTSKAYYLFSKYVLQNKNERDVSDFFAINRDVANRVIENYKTRLRFIRSFVQFESKNRALVNYENGARHAGVSRYNYRVLLKLAMISELSRFKYFRDRKKATKENPIYMLDEKRSMYE